MMEQIELQRAIEAILFASGERIEVSRLAMTLETDPKDIIAAADALADELAFNRRGIRILRLDDGYQMVSSGEMAEYVTAALETRKPPKLSSSQLETLTIIAYYQPATKAMVEQIRGVDLLVQYHRITLRTSHTNRKSTHKGDRLSIRTIECHLAHHRIVDGTVLTRAGHHAPQQGKRAEKTKGMTYLPHQNSFSIL